MKKAQELYDAIRKITKADDDILPGIVKAVNNDKTIDAEFDGLLIEGCRLQSISDASAGQVVKPAIDSIVLLKRIGRGNEFGVWMFSEVDEIKTIIATTSLKQDATGFEIKKGADTLASCIDDLINEILLIYAPMNKPTIAAIQTRIANILK